MEIDPDRLAPVLRDHGVAVAYLFGSRAKGTARPDSDVDIAVLFTEPPSSYTEQIHLGDALTDLLGAEVDVIDLDRVRLGLRARVLQEGKLLYSSDEPRRVEFQVRTLSTYLDFKPYQEPLAKAFLARVAARGLGG